MTMGAPIVDPDARPQDGIAPANSYPSGAAVWVHRGGSWRPGCVLESSPLAAMVRYRPTDNQGTAVDTVRAVNLLSRVDPDQIDHLTDGPSSSAVRPRRAGHDAAAQLREQAAGCQR